MTFTVAIVGRPNVGKSTLFNRLCGKRRALVDDQPGVTRDRREGAASLGPMEFTVFDTAGWEEAAKGTLSARMTESTELAIKDADVTLMVIDGRAGVTQMDKHFANLIRRSKKPVVLVVNKAEANVAAALSEAYSLGLGEAHPISAEHGEGMSLLYDLLSPFAAEDKDEEEERETEETPMQIAIIGRPNVGKSTLFNYILGEQRTLTGPEAGITRDSIMVDFNFEGRPLKLVDTAGMRRKAGITDKIEKMAVGDTLETLRYAHVVIWMVDAQQPLEKQDNAIGSLIEQEGRAIVLAVNKWDEIKDKVAYMKAIDERIQYVLPQCSGVTIVPISAETGFNIPKLLSACFKAYSIWNRQIGTGALNRWLETALLNHTPPLIKGRRIKIRYMTQKTARPPTFILFSNTSDVPDHYMRYLVNDMRGVFKLPGVPIRLRIRKNKNPYEGKKEKD